MKYTLTFLWLCMLSIISCSPQKEVAPMYPVKDLLHQKSWKVVSMQAERKSDGEISDWYAQLQPCVKDNVFIIEAPGTGMVGELHGEEGSILCSENDLAYQPHIAGWKLNGEQNIFAVSLFASGHQMLYGYDMEEPYENENWMIVVLDKEKLQVQVSKNQDGIAYEVIIEFKSVL